MYEMARDPVLWTGLVMLAGTLGAMAARAVRGPAACGALLGGFALGAVGGGGGSRPDFPLVTAALLGFLAFLLGTELDLARLARIVRTTIRALALQTAAIAALTFLACLALGIEPAAASLVAVASVAGSPVAVVAVTSESRARGDLTGSILLASSLSLPLAAALACLVVGSPRRLAAVAGALATGLIAGLVVLVPLSRMATRAAIVTASAGGALLMVAAATWLGSSRAHLIVVAAVAGAMAGNLTPNHETIRSALRDVSSPAAVTLYALAGAGVAPSDLRGLFLPAAVAVVIARGLSLAVVGRVTRGPDRGLLDLSLLPTAGSLVVASAVAGIDLTGNVALQMVTGILLVAGFLSECTGMIATRWALDRSGEAAGLSEDPEAWRARMT